MENGEGRGHELCGISASWPGSRNLPVICVTIYLAAECMDSGLAPCLDLTHSPYYPHQVPEKLQENMQHKSSAFLVQIFAQH